MTHAPSTSPTPPPPAPPPATARDEPVRSAIVVALAAAAFGVVAGLTIGFGFGWLAAESAAADCPPSDGWCGLGAALVGFLLGAAAGATAYVAAGVVTIVRSRPAGRRRRLIAAHIALPPALVACAALLGALIDAVT